MNSLGKFEQIVLLAVVRLDTQAYGVSILREIERCTGREPSIGALYTTLNRMESKHLLSSRIGEPTAERGGRAKRYYTATNLGRNLVASAQAGLRNLSDGLTLLRGATCPIAL